MNDKIFKNYKLPSFLILLSSITIWILSINNIVILKYWYAFSMICLLTIKIFMNTKNNYHYLITEICNYINILSIIVILFNLDVRIIYSFTNGPLLLYGIFVGKNFNLLTFVINSYSILMSIKIYSLLYNDSINIDYDETFFNEFKNTMIIYFFWFILYSIYLIFFNGKPETITKNILNITNDYQYDFYSKISWLIMHFILIIYSCSFGIIIKFALIFNIIVIIIMFLVSLFHICKFLL